MARTYFIGSPCPCDIHAETDRCPFHSWYIVGSLKVIRRERERENERVAIIISSWTLLPSLCFSPFIGHLAPSLSRRERFKFRNLTYRVRATANPTETSTGMVERMEERDGFEERVSSPLIENAIRRSRPEHVHDGKPTRTPARETRS